MVRTGLGWALLLIGCLAVFFCLAWGAGTVAAEGATGYSRSSDAIRICILPFYTSTVRASWDSNLGPLLEGALSRHPWMKVVPTRTVYDLCYEVQPQPWLVRGFWEEGRAPTDAEVFVGLRQRLLPRVKARFPADYYVWGRVITTGVRKTVFVEVTESRTRKETVLTSTRQAETAEAIPEALEEVAAEIAAFLEPGWLVANLEETRKEYLAQICSLSAAVKKAEEQVEAYPEMVALGVVLLSLYEENKEAYGKQAREKAADIAQAWDAQDKDVTGLAEKLGVDPFLILCREQAKGGDWSGVLETCRLGMEKYPLRSAKYEKWRLRAEKRLKANQATGEGDSSDKETL